MGGQTFRYFQEIYGSLDMTAACAGGQVHTREADSWPRGLQIEKQTVKHFRERLGPEVWIDIA
jgi:hypothetical protein